MNWFITLKILLIQARVLGACTWPEWFMVKDLRSGQLRRIGLAFIGNYMQVNLCWMTVQCIQFFMQI
jgi:hypothetical protein